MPMTISIEDGLKDSFSATCKEIGITPSTAFGIFAKAVVREQRIPFELSAISVAERKVREAEQRINQGIAQGYAEYQVGQVITRAESRKMREDMKANLA
ncbi:type II toxin-antitoxin system RelB/DinJ family antitoxin [Adlercreutzia sp. ZJ154]|uniref:type II toxin-antitoxin system RelB/DinJ family antitoxin n=1 Tax=Adlercreutzia sp. ZJ154 TaxID=2709790 RepID=UPI0013E9E963|nr:type II toxin-antitoxin system RelB/DinJ family antitoxin [Adlercreutzia sp. ZJ154]